MILGKIMKAFKKNASYDERIDQWLNKQSHPEDALIYLIEKELYEYGQRDLSYVIPRKRNDGYFEALLERESYDSRFHTNMDLYDSIAHIHTEEVVRAKKETPSPVKPAPIDLHHKTHSPNYIPKGGSITSVNKKREIYNASSSVVVTAPETQYDDKTVDMSCFED